VVRPIGKGKFGVISLVKEKASAGAPRYAMKKMALAKLTDEQRDEVLREASVLERLGSHPYILSMHEAFYDRSCFFCIILEYCEKTDLAALVRAQKTKPFSESLIRRWLAQLVLGIEHLQRCTVVHRDLKPSNVMVTDAYDLRVGDFGFAIVVENGDVFTNGILCGTPNFMSPELLEKIPDAKSNVDDLRETKFSFKSDLWALGCLVHEIITLCAAFKAVYDRHGLNWYALKSMVMKGKTQPLPATLSPDIATVLQRLLTKSIEKRCNLEELKALPAVSSALHELAAAGPMGL
jgi:NIMA (never in mitosis gene a)-related kinase